MMGANSKNIKDKIKIAVVGTQGVPSRYGGFETLVEYIAENLAQEYEITVFCSGKIYRDRLSNYKGCKLVYINFFANGIESVFYDIVSLIKSRKRFDKVLILGSSGGIAMPFLRKYRNKFILNFGGLDWQRSKWGWFSKRFLKISEALAIRNSKFLISDNIGIQKYILRTYGRESEMIAYGGDQVLNVYANREDYNKYGFLNISYAFSVARIQPDNNIDMILDAFVDGVTMPMVFVGNWENSEYGKRTKEKYKNYSNIILLDAIYDQHELDLLRSNCKVYIHGHSAGGTNPSLVEAMNLCLPVFAFSSGFNENTTENAAKYFSSSWELKNLVLKIKSSELESIGKKMKSIASEKYKWSIVTRGYSKIFEK